MLSAQSHTRAARLAAAAVGAISRLSAVPVAFGAPELFGAAGEGVLWIAALDDLLRRADATYDARRASDPGGASLPGIRYARNALTHGNRVAAVAAVHPGSEPGMLMLGVSQLGTVSQFTWLSRGQIGHVARKTLTSADEEQCYDRLLAGRELVSSLTLALNFLRREANT